MLLCGGELDHGEENGMKQITVIVALVLTIINGGYAAQDTTPKGSIPSGDIHKTRCVTLDRNNQPDGGEFIVEADKKTLLASVSVTKQTSLLEAIQPFNSEEATKPGEFSFTVCKNDNNPDFSLSYEICGIEITFGGTSLADEGDTTFVFSSKFNLGRDIPSFKGQIKAGDYARNLFKDPRHITNKLLRWELEINAVGHITPYPNGFADFDGVVKTQCESLSDNSIVVEGANH